MADSLRLHMISFSEAVAKCSALNNLLEVGGRNVFLLEDCKDRQSFFSKKLLRHNLHVEETAEGATGFFLEDPKRWDLIFLAHDLHDTHYTAPLDHFRQWQKKNTEKGRPQTGYNFAKAIAPHLTEQQMVVCHSLNRPGRQMILEALPQALMIDFLELTAVM